MSISLEDDWDRRRRKLEKKQRRFSRLTHPWGILVPTSHSFIIKCGTCTYSFSPYRALQHQAYCHNSLAPLRNFVRALTGCKWSDFDTRLNPVWRKIVCHWQFGVEESHRDAGINPGGLLSGRLRQRSLRGRRHLRAVRKSRERPGPQITLNPRVVNDIVVVQQEAHYLEIVTGWERGLRRIVSETLQELGRYLDKSRPYENVPYLHPDLEYRRLCYWGTLDLRRDRKEDAQWTTTW